MEQHNRGIKKFLGISRGPAKIRQGVDGSLTAKLVFWGPSLAGKTTALTVYWSLMQFMASSKVVGKLTKVQDPGHRTLLFDQAAFIWQEQTETETEIKYQVYTVPGLAHLGVQRKIVLQGVDGLILMIDAERAKWTENKLSLKELIKIKDNTSNTVIGERILLKDLPFQIMLNKIDLPPALQINTEEISALLREIGPGAEEIFAGAESKITSISTQMALNVLKDLLREELAHSNRERNPLPDPLLKIEEPINKLMEQLCQPSQVPSK